MADKDATTTAIPAVPAPQLVQIDISSFGVILGSSFVAGFILLLLLLTGLFLVSYYLIVPALNSIKDSQSPPV